MCNLNILIQKLKKGKGELSTSFLSSVTSLSYSENSDGDGLYTDVDDLLVRSEYKINLFEFRKRIAKSNFIITHQRISTSGFSDEFIQPFKNPEFVFAHNGVVDDYDKDDKSDSYNMFKKFNKMFKRSYKKTRQRQKSVIRTINNLFYKIGWGSYSIVIYDKIDKKIYYFKNDRTDISIYKNHKYLYLTTNEDNEKFLTLLNEDFEKIEIKDFGIYTIGSALKIKKVGKIREPKYYSVTEINEGEDVKDEDDEGSLRTMFSDVVNKEEMIERASKDFYDENRYMTYNHYPKQTFDINKKGGKIIYSKVSLPCHYCKTQTNLIYEDYRVCEFCLGIQSEAIGNEYFKDYQRNQEMENPEWEDEGMNEWEKDLFKEI